MDVKKIIFALLISSTCLTSVAWAEFQVNPTLTLREEYNDNIYLERSKESDFITYINPALLLDWNTALFDLSLTLGIDYEKYWHNSAEDDLRPSTGSKLESTFHLYRDIFLFHIVDTYDRVPIDYAGKGGQNNTLVNLTDKNVLILNPYLLFQLSSTLQARFDYKYENIWYRDDNGDNAGNHHYTATLTKELSARVSADLSASYMQYRPRDTSSSLIGQSGKEEYDRSSTKLGLLWQASDQLSIRASVGKIWHDYDYSPDYNSMVYSANVDSQPSSAVKVGAGYIDDVIASVDEGAQHEKKYSAYIGYSERASAKLTIFHSRNEYVEINRDDDAWGATLNGAVPITDKHGITWLLDYTDYSEDNIEDYQRYGGHVEFYQQLRLGRASIGYTYNRNNSDVRDNEYTNNIVFAKLALKW